MEMINGRTMIATLLLFLLVAVPSFSRGSFSMVVVFAEGLDVKNKDSEVYVIDYRGPETHTFIPPPNRRTNMSLITTPKEMGRKF
ncbi:hypothetical protein Sango_1469200 [Sesamum angolense]|uniref:Uncharacterized protein n=1 Tax=Sesamum angolense TaxID=2727404 RepID=A0AAE1WMZ5_9LAMI|nr:hypothetical protein Sango_1469200 [Sesamum angolense]